MSLLSDLLHLPTFMSEAQSYDVCLQVPEFRVAYTVTTDKLDTLYKKLKPKGVTMTALLAKAAGIALSKHPAMYAGSDCHDKDI